MRREEDLNLQENKKYLHHSLNFDIILSVKCFDCKSFLKKEGYEKWTTNESMNI